MVAYTVDAASLHVPPEVASIAVVVEPTQTTSVPVIAAGMGLTVITAVTGAPVVVYEMVAVPAVCAVTIPEDAPMLATAGLLLVHVPVTGVEDNVDEPPGQSDRTPVIGVCAKEQIASSSATIESSRCFIKKIM